MEKEYHKLVRDRIPEIIHQSGNECEFVILSDPEYRQALRQKLIEGRQGNTGVGQPRVHQLTHRCCPGGIRARREAWRDLRTLALSPPRS